MDSRKNLPTFTVETEYDNGLKTSNEVQAPGGIRATDKAVATDRKVHGEKLDKCKNAIHTVFSGGEELKPKVETIFT